MSLPISMHHISYAFQTQLLEVRRLVVQLPLVAQQCTCFLVYPHI